MATGVTQEKAGAGVAGELPIEAEGFLTHLTVERGRSERTISAYRSDLRRCGAFLERRSTDLLSATAADLEAWSAELRSSGLAPASVARMLVSARGLYRHLTAEGIIAADPTADLELPGQPEALPKALTSEEVAAILDAVAAAADSGDPASLRDAALLEFLYGTGARVSEACGVGFGDLDMDAGTARLLGKRDKERVVPFGAPARRALAAWLDGGRPALLIPELINGALHHACQLHRLVVEN